MQKFLIYLTDTVNESIYYMSISSNGDFQFLFLHFESLQAAKLRNSRYLFVFVQSERIN